MPAPPLVEKRFLLIDKAFDNAMTESLDPELCDHFQLGPNFSTIINPFDLGPDDGHSDNPSEQKIETLLSLLHLMLASEGNEKFADLERELLEERIRYTYLESARYSIVPTLSYLAEVTLQASANEGVSGKRDCLSVLFRGMNLYNSNHFGSWIDGWTNVQCTKSLVIFDISELKELRLEKIASCIIKHYAARQGGGIVTLDANALMHLIRQVTRHR